MSKIKRILNVLLDNEREEDRSKIQLSEPPTVEELEKYYDAKCLSPSGYPIFYCENHMNGIQVTTNYYVCNTDKYPDAVFRNYLICGGQGSGKTTSSFIPNYLNPELKNSSFIILDTSGENYEKTSEFQRRMGRDVYLLSLDECADRFNILDFIENRSSNILNYCKKLLTSSMLSVSSDGSISDAAASWFSMSASLLATAIILLKDFYNKNPHLGKATVCEAIKIIEECDDDEFFEWVKNCPAAFNMYPFKKAKQREKGVMFTNCLNNITTNLSFLKDDSVAYFMSDSTIDIKNIRKKPTAIYIKGHPTDSFVNAPILAPIIEFFLDELKKQSAVVNSNLDKNEICDVYLFLDEIITLGKIDNLKTNLNNLRKYRCTTFLGIQNVNQFYDIYNERETKNVISSLRYKVIFNCNGDEDTALMLSNSSEQYEEIEYDPIYNSEWEITGYRQKTVTKKEISFEDACNIESDTAYLNIGPIGTIKIDNISKHFEEKRFVKVEDIHVSIKNNYENLSDKINIYNETITTSPFLNYHTKNSTLINYPKKENQSMQEVAFGCDDKKSIKEEDIIIKNIEKFIEENFIDDIF